MLLERHVLLTLYHVIFYPNPATFQLATMSKLLNLFMLEFSHL